MNPLGLVRSLAEAGLRATLRIAARRHWTSAAARVCGATVHRPPGVRAPGAGARQVLVLPRTAALQDVADVAAASTHLNFVAPWHGAMKALASAYLPPEVDSNTYHLDAGPAVTAAKLRYREFLAGMWTSLRRSTRIDAVISSNFSYYSERELAIALGEMGVPFVVLQKENLKTPGRVAFFDRLYRDRRGPFVGRRMLVYNGIERDLQVAAGIVPPERIAVVGMPRMDRLHRWRLAQQPHSRPPALLFFDFDERNGLPVVTRKALEGGFEAFDPVIESLAWRELCAGTRAAVMRVARENPGLRVIIKTKGRTRSDNSLDAHLERDPLPGNVQVVRGGDPIDLLKEATVVCGFNSTSLLEGLAAGVPVVVPHFAEATESAYAPFLLDLLGAAALAPDSDALAAMLARIAFAGSNTRDLAPSAVAALQHWTGNADGNAGARVAREIVATIDG